MKKFKFRLEKVMDIRAEQERQKQMALAEAQMALAQEEEKLQGLMKLVDDQKTAIESIRSSEKRIDPRMMSSRYDYIRKLERDMVLQRQHIRNAEKEVDKRRAALLEAAKERKKYENLKARQREAYEAVLNRKEQAELDDLAITHYSGDKE